MSKKKPVASENPEFAGIDAALRRAAKSALALARKTKTPCYVWKDGEIVDLCASSKRKKTGEGHADRNSGK